MTDLEYFTEASSNLISRQKLVTHGAAMIRNSGSDDELMHIVASCWHHGLTVPHNCTFSGIC